MNSDALAEDSMINQSLKSNQPKSGTREGLAFVFFSLVTCVAMLYEFGATLNSYFTSDDLVLVKYVYGVFNGDPGLLLRMFATVWMPDSTQEIFYRPLVEVSYALDFLFSGTNPLGYHISNFLYSFVAALALFSIGRDIARRFALQNADWIGYAAGLLFALNPMHTEVTSWIVGRVDGLCTMFYLISLALFLRVSTVAGDGGPKKSVAWCLSLVAFVFALLAKEMAFTLPPSLFLLCIFSSDEKNFLRKLREAFWETLPYFIVLALFLPLRALAIGTFVGGYVGALGEAMQKPLGVSFEKLTHLLKAAYPFNGELVSSDSALAMSFHVFYAGAAIYVIARMLFDKIHPNQLKVLSFLLFWLVIQYLPLLQVFRLSDSLAGARLFYLSTAILALILAVILVASGPTTISARSKLLQLSSIVLIGFLSVLYAVTGRINNQALMLAGLHTQELQKQIKEAVAQLPEKKKLLVAYLPSQVFGAFLFNRYYALQALISPPLLEPGIAERVCSLEPRFYISDMTIPSGLLRRKLAEQEKYRAVFWNVDTFKLTDIESLCDPYVNGETAPSQQHSLPELTINTKDGHESIYIESVRPFATGAVRFIEVELENSQPAANAGNLRRMYLRFEDKPEPPHSMDYWSSFPYNTGLKTQILRFPVDEVFAWFMLKQRSNFQISLGMRGNLKIRRARLLDGRDMRPRLLEAAENLRSCNDGVERPTGFPLKFSFDVSNIPDARSCLCELSRPRMMFQLENYTYRSAELSKKPLKTWKVDGTTGSIVIDKRDFPEAACYQLRIFALKSNGQIAGTSSDIIYLGIDDRPKGQEL